MITVNQLEQIGFTTVGDCTRYRISVYLELCFMHFDNAMRLQTVGSGFTERIDVKTMLDVCEFIHAFGKVIEYQPQNAP